MKKIRYVLRGMCLAGGVIVCLAGCGGQQEEQRYAWPLATASPEDTVTQIYAEKFAEEVSRLSEGRMKIQVYPNSVLGGDRELLESCYDGDIPFVVQNTAPQVNFIPAKQRAKWTCVHVHLATAVRVKYPAACCAGILMPRQLAAGYLTADTAVFDAPCVFERLEDVRAAVDDPEFLGLMQEKYREAGYELLGYSDQGFRVMSTNQRVETLEDFKGQKIRTMENSYHMEFWKRLNANPTPMSFSEVYIGLQQNTIDAQENPYEVIVSNRLYEQQDYIVETNHLPHLLSLIVSEAFFQELTQEEQSILIEAGEIAKTYSREASDERIAERIETIKSSGTQIVTLSDKLYQQMIECSRPVYEEIQENVSGKIVEGYFPGE